MTTQAAQPAKLSRRANAKSWWYAYMLYKKKHPGKDICLIVTRGLPVLMVISAFFVLREGLSVMTFWNSSVLMTGWCVWVLAFLLARHGINECRRKWNRFRA